AACANTNDGPDGVKALPLAAELEVTQIIKLLVEAGANPNVDHLEVRGLSSSSGSLSFFWFELVFQKP
ncbi:hypothetical protein MKX01_017963, partial [Papaver californicum]